jgi:two-component system, NarL family, nitrate/nitrite response regulator NarL
MTTTQPLSALTMLLSRRFEPVRELDRPTDSGAVRNFTFGAIGVTNQISIIVADDHPVVLCGVLRVLRREPDFKVLASLSEGSAALKAIRELGPDLAVLDVRMPGMDGLAILSEMGESSATRVVLLTATATDAQIAAAIRYGARGVVLKQCAADRLVECIREVAAGRHWFPADLVNETPDRASERSAEEDRREQTLTVRERQIITLVAEGLSNKQVGRHLNLAEGTVKIHLHHIYDNIGVPNRTALAAVALGRREQVAATTLVPSDIAADATLELSER